MVEASIFIAAIIAGTTEAIKSMFPGKVYGIVTVVVALLAGVAVSLLDTTIGIVDITVAQGVMISLGAIGTVGTVKKIG